MKYVLLLFSLVCMNSYGLEKLTGVVTVVEPSYMPDTISFQMSTGNATCPKNTWFKWRKEPENNKVVYGTLLAALISGKKINFYFNDGDKNCTGTHLHLLSDR